MTTETVKQELRPFDETIVEAISWASSREMLVLGELIKETKIKRGHDQIIAMWEKRMEHWGIGDTHGVLANLIQQKREAEKKAPTDLASSFDSDGKERALMVVIEKTISIVRDMPSHPLDLPTNRKVEKIFRFFETAKKISRAENEQEFRAVVANLCEE